MRNVAALTVFKTDLMIVATFLGHPVVRPTLRDACVKVDSLAYISHKSLDGPREPEGWCHGRYTRRISTPSNTLFQL